MVRPPVPVHPPVTVPPKQALYWSVRRELWENRSIYIAPLSVAAVILFGLAMSTIGLPHRRRATLLLDPAQQRFRIEQPYIFAAGMLVITAFLVGFFYCLDALHGERRDRSILFWKSLPVSDRTTVLSKMAIPLVVLPVIVFAIVVALQVDMLLLSNAILLSNGLPTATPDQLPLVQFWFTFLYALVAMAIYGWLLLVSAWAKRAMFLWSVLPFLVICIFEWVTFRTIHFATFIRYRTAGWVTQAFVPHVKGTAPMDPLTSIDLEKYLRTPGLWLGILVAVGFLALTIQLRRYREPI
jgi:ABC-2 type transport system permease protein